jgi:hypothetical protein
MTQHTSGVLVSCVHVIDEHFDETTLPDGTLEDRAH